MSAFSQPLPLAVLISGGGRTLLNLLQRQAAGQLPIDVRLVVASRPDAGGLRHAQSHGIDSRVVIRKQHDTPEAYRDTIFQLCREAGAECVVMAGFMKHVLIPADFENRVVNIHPSLIPSFCGQGAYGEHVHRRVMESGVRVSGCTVHFVDNHYDNGPIIVQRTVEVRDDDTPETLAARVFQQECEALPEALQLLSENRLRVVGRRVVRAST